MTDDSVVRGPVSLDRQRAVMHGHLQPGTGAEKSGRRHPCARRLNKVVPLTILDRARRQRCVVSGSPRTP
jgi:hypothetical protein